MKFLELKNHLKSNLDKLYLLTGTDVFLQRLSEDLFIEKFNSIGQDINVLIIETLTSENLDNHFSSARLMPFLGDRRMMIIRSYDKNIFEKIVTGLKKIIEDDVSCSIVINDSDSKIKNSLKNKATEIDCSHLDTASILKYISNKVSKSKRLITRDAGKKLIDYCNNNLGDIDNELKKIAYYVEKGKRITIETIDVFVKQSVEYKIFELTNYLGQKDSVNALKVLDQLLINKVSEMAILTLVYNHFSRLFHISINKKLSNKQLCKYLKIKEYAVFKARSQAAKFKASHIMQILNDVMVTEHQIKTGNMDAKTAIYNLILDQLAKNK